MFARLANATFAKGITVSSLPPEDSDIKDLLHGRYVSLAQQYNVPESLLSQHNAYGIDVNDVLVTRNFVPKFRINDTDDFFADANRNTIYITNYKELEPNDFGQVVQNIGNIVESKNIRVESTDDPHGF
jgi:hypothetical protein